MKQLTLTVMLFFLLCSSALADLTKNDVQEIRTVVKDELQVLRVELHQVEKRLDQRINTVENLMYVLLAGMFALVGFVLWDRRSAVAPLQRSQRELEDREQKLEKAILEYSRQEPKLAQILKSFGLL